ncbi:MAG: hypothetical protein ISS16_00955 [Ignavibacteria bacterium]|nr:hypothetical protein [Ignavibacteria bacterium]
MLDTLLKIGKWQSQGKGEWARFLDKPKIQTEDKKGNKISHFILPIIFDLDEMEVIIDAKNLREYDESDISKYFLLKNLGRRFKPFYSASLSGKYEQVFKSFFGKPLTEVKYGELKSIIIKDYPNLDNSKFTLLIDKIFKLKSKAEILITEEDGEGNSKINFLKIIKDLNLERSENVAMIYIEVKYKEFGINDPKPFAELDEYREFLELKYSVKDYKKKSENLSNVSSKKLCYANNEYYENVTELNLTAGYSLNKMFVTTTQNYINRFDKKNAAINYQVSVSNQEKLDFASKYLLEKYRISIANIDHVIIPQFRESENLDWEMVLTGIKKKADILFHFNTLEDLVKNIEDETEDIFWINFMAYESDGNFFKSTELIKDVSNFHFQKVIQAFSDIHWELKEANYIDWNSVMTEYGNPGRFFNLNTIYGLIPIRKDKEKRNKALDLFKSILENRNINHVKLFDYFCELILCHYYERYNSYNNIIKSSKDYFGKTVRDSVFKYHAFIQVLKKLNLINMEKIKPITEETRNKYDQAIQDFFNKMQLNTAQQSMFYLGRMLNAVEFVQIKKKIKKTVINKVNFNGMDIDDIERLRKDLIEKSRQHNTIGKIIFTDRKFGELFDFNNWKLNPKEAVFFLLTGYSFGISTKEAKEIEDVETEETEN